MQFEYDDPIPIVDSIFWVGFVEEHSRLHCNPYLIMDNDEAVLVDPGSIPDFSRVMRKVIEVTPPDKVSTMILSHQDPDVCGNIAVMEEVIGSHEINIAAHLNTIRLVRHIGVQSPFYDIEKHDFKLQLKSGRELQFFPIPFLHSPGSMITYDAMTGSLFTGDLFGGISADWQLFAHDDFTEAMRVFHQAYMPSNAILRQGLKIVEDIQPVRILPQHGSVLDGPRVKQTIEYLKDLPCACDLMEQA